MDPPRVAAVIGHTAAARNGGSLQGDLKEEAFVAREGRDLHHRRTVKVTDAAHEKA
jgi:hypothetical protein